MGISGSKKQTNMIQSSERIEGIDNLGCMNDNPGSMSITAITNEPVRKIALEISDDKEVDNTLKTTEPIQETQFAVAYDVGRNKKAKAFEPTHRITYAVSMDTEIRNEIKPTAERAIKLKRTCSKYTALEGKVANVGEVYDIDEDLASDTDDSEVELIQPEQDVKTNPNEIPIRTIKTGYHTHLKHQHSVTKRNKHKIDRQRHADFRREHVAAECYSRDSFKEMPSVTEIPGLCFERDLTESNSDIKRCDQRRERAKPMKKSKLVAWEPLKSNDLYNSSTTTNNNSPYFGIGGINKLHTEDNDYVNNYISTSIVMPFNNICIFSTDTENIISDSKNDPYNDKTRSTCEPHRVFQVIPDNKASSKPSGTVIRTGDSKDISQKDKTKKTYRLLRYPLRVKVNPYSDVCEVSLPKRMLDDLQVSAV